MRILRCLIVPAGFWPATFLLTILSWPASNASGEPITLQSALDKLRPYQSGSKPADPKPTDSKPTILPGAVDRTTLTGKIMCGYQGWYTAPGDGSGRGWTHYGRQGRFEPGQATIDQWPDTSELDADEKFATPFRQADGTVAHVFSSHARKTVLRHFRWMSDYGIDGAFVQRFAVETIHPKTIDSGTVDPKSLHHANTVLMHCREGANLHGRAYAVMYDLTSLRAGQMKHVIEDWKSLVDRARVSRDGNDKAYLHHRGKPVVAVWGVGFSDGRKYTLAECEQLIRFLKSDRQYGGCTVMLGVPAYWRTLDRDSLADPKLHEVIALANIVSPWSVGRFDSPQSAAEYGERTWKADLAWCQAKGLDYLPVTFPGFSWHNLRPSSPLDQIPRRRGQFLWSQFVAAQRAGATMLYQAMFDEMDEGTAIFKTTDSPPVGASRFLTNEGLPSDHYLWLTGTGGRLIRGEIEPTAAPPKR